MCVSSPASHVAEALPCPVLKEDKERVSGVSRSRVGVEEPAQLLPYFIVIAINFRGEFEHLGVRGEECQGSKLKHNR